MDIFEVKGMRELHAFLNKFPVHIEVNVMRGALRAGANVIARIARGRCPKGPPPKSPGQKKFGHRSGLLRDSIRVGVSSRQGRVKASVRAGGEVRKGLPGIAYYAHMVEKGTKPHTIKAGPGKRFPWGGKVVKHPGAKPKPFMRPALDQGAQAAITMVRDYVSIRLKVQHGIDTGR